MKLSPITTKQQDILKYPDINDPVLSELKRLAAITIDSNASELEIIKVIVGYAHSLFTHNGDNIPSSSDRLTILKVDLVAKFINLDQERWELKQKIATRFSTNYLKQFSKG